MMTNEGSRVKTRSGILCLILVSAVWVLACFLLLLRPSRLEAGNGTQIDLDGYGRDVANLTTIVLYDGSLGGTPDTQGYFEYGTQPFPPSSGTQIFSNGVTILDTSATALDYAGYAVSPTLMPVLKRTSGFTLNFTVRVATEAHAGSDKDGDGTADRAGFSVILLGDDARGVELGFWEGEVWAQEDDDAEPPDGNLFTHAEGTAFDTTADLTNYALSILSDTYTLSSEGSPILSGPVRDYSGFVPPPGIPNPYAVPNALFLGDDTPSALAKIELASVSLTIPETVEFLYLPLIRKS